MLMAILPPYATGRERTELSCGPEMGAWRLR